MSKSVFDIIKKQNGETFAKAIRNYDNGIFDIPNIVEIVKYAGRDAAPILKFLGSLKNIEIKQAKKPTETPFELLHRAGYHAKYADNLQKQNSIQKYFKANEELCTFRDNSRYRKYYIINAVRYDVDSIKRENFTQPYREDAYGTSVISIQILKDGGFISIKNRYNHTVTNPDNTFSSNPDNIIDGLSASLRQYFNVDFSSHETSLPGGYAFVNNRIIHFNTEVNNVYFGEDFFVKDGIVHELDNDSELMLSHFVFDLKNKWLVNIADAPDGFEDAFEENIAGKNIKVIKNKTGEKIITADDEEIVRTYNGKIIKAYLPKTTVLRGKNFLRRNTYDAHIYLPNLERFPNYSIQECSIMDAAKAWEELRQRGVQYSQPPYTFKNRLQFRWKLFKENIMQAVYYIGDLNEYNGAGLYFIPFKQQAEIDDLKSKFNAGAQRIKNKSPKGLDIPQHVELDR